MRFLLVAAAMLLSVAAAFAADPVGTYNVEGTYLSGSRYSGTVTVTKTGETYKVVWEIVGGHTFTGTAIGNGDFMAIGYVYDKGTGLELAVADGGNWNCLYAPGGGTKIGRETWKRQ
jgi:hypothetical protein